MKVKVKKIEDHFPEWVKAGEEYYCEPDGNVGWYKVSEGEKAIIINEDYLEIVEGQISKETLYQVTESQLKAFQKAAILAQEYCQEALVEHEKKVGRSILRKEVILEEGLKKDLTYLEDVVECFEDIFPEKYE
jgi:hypothetical protein